MKQKSAKPKKKKTNPPHKKFKAKAKQQHKKYNDVRTIVRQQVLAPAVEAPSVENDNARNSTASDDTGLTFSSEDFFCSDPSCPYGNYDSYESFDVFYPGDDEYWCCRDESGRRRWLTGNIQFLRPSGSTEYKSRDWFYHNGLEDYLDICFRQHFVFIMLKASARLGQVAETITLLGRKSPTLYGKLLQVR